MGIVVDTSVLIRLERTNSPRPFARFGLPGGIFISAITLSEMRVGIELADNEKRRAKRESFVASVLTDAVVLSFGQDEAPTHAGLCAKLRRTGTMIGAHDLLIAATAVHHGHAVVTANFSEFERVDGLTVLCWTDP